MLKQLPSSSHGTFWHGSIWVSVWFFWKHIRFLFFVPFPQVAEQSLHSDQSPVDSWVTKSSGSELVANVVLSGFSLSFSITAFAMMPELDTIIIRKVCKKYYIDFKIGSIFAVFLSFHMTIHFWLTIDSKVDVIMLEESNILRWN